MAMITAGWTYKFKFKSLFSSLDGTYTISKIYSWLELMNEQISIYDILYAPLKISEDQYNTDIFTYRDGNVYKLVSPVDGAIIYMPEGTFDTFPLYTVQEYQNLVVFLPLGIHNNAEQLEYLVEYLRDNLQAGLGIKQEPKVVAVGSSYLTEKEYDEMVAVRNANIKKILNTATALNKANDEIASLKATISGYEQILKDTFGSTT